MTDAVKTIADIAKLAGVAKSTVSRALNDSPLISQETRERIRAIAQDHHFEAHQAARCLSLQRTNTVALIIPLVQHVGHFITDPFFVELLRGIMISVAALGYDLLVGHPRPNAPGDVRRYLDSKRADGLILIGCHGYVRSITGLFSQQSPIIVWGAAQEQIFCSVNCDNVTGGRLAVQHLVQVGRKRIAFLGGFREEPEVTQRYQGYTAMLQETGRAADPAVVLYGDYSSRAGYENMQKLLKNTPDVDGVFACSDLMAIGAMEAIREFGRRVPEDISIVGFDDVPLAEYCSPPLTTIRQNITKAGEVMVRNLIQYLEDEIITRTILPVQLIVRKSSETGH